MKTLPEFTYDLNQLMNELRRKHTSGQVEEAHLETLCLAQMVKELNERLLKLEEKQKVFVTASKKPQTV